MPLLLFHHPATKIKISPDATSPYIRIQIAQLLPPEIPTPRYFQKMDLVIPLTHQPTPTRLIGYIETMPGVPRVFNSPLPVQMFGMYLWMDISPAAQIHLE